MDYAKHYQNLIDANRSNKATKYTEAHHIVPRSLSGADTEDNIVHLTVRQHYIAHLILAQLHPNQWFAVQAMLSDARNPRRPKRYKQLTTKRWVRKQIAFAFARAAREKHRAIDIRRNSSSYRVSNN